MTDTELLNELVKRKLLSPDLRERTLKDAELSGRSAEDVLYENRLVDETLVAKVKSELLNIPYRAVDPEAISEEALALVPPETSKTYRIIPLERDEKMFVAGMLNPEDERAQEALRFIAKRERLSLGVYIVTPSDLAAVWRRYTPYQGIITSAVKELDVREEDTSLVSLEGGARSEEEAPIIKIVASTLREAVQSSASDIHIEPQHSRLRVRFRINGKLQEVASLPRALSAAVISRVKVLARLRLDETRIPQDGRFRSVVLGREIDFRISTFPTPAGEKVAIRVLDPTTGLKSLEEIGLSYYNAGVLESALRAPYGMILLTGPTGSGKTTTLYAIMQKINSESINVVSLEDPIEYFMEGINQSQVRPEIGYTFASGLRQILRQDPNIIMVGEIRDSETASLAVNAALTGHMMLSTLHTNNALGVVPRLVDLGVPAFFLPSALNVMIAQRLVIRLCPDCRKEIKAPPEIASIIEKNLASLPENIKEKELKPPYTIFRIHTGTENSCKTCGGKGIAGRVAIFEIFKMTRELGSVIVSGYDEGKLRDEAKRQNMVTMRQDGIIKALKGEVLIEEVLRATEE